MTANLDQPRSQEYVSDAISHIKKKCPTSGGKAKGERSWDFASAALFQVVLSALSAKQASLDKRDIVSSEDLKGITDSFKGSLLGQLRSLLKKPAKLASTGSESETGLELLTIVDALSTLGLDGTKLAELVDDVKSFIASFTEAEREVASRLETFISAHARDTDGDLLDTELKGNTSTIYGRKGIFEQATALTTGKSQQDKLDLLRETFGENLVGLSQLDKLLAARHIISSCKGLLVLTLPDSRANKYSYSTRE
jgi:nucleolar pre-ribosomal-associated protein 2